MREELINYINNISATMIIQYLLLTIIIPAIVTFLFRLIINALKSIRRGKNWKAYDYTVIGKIYDESFKNYLSKYGVMAIEAVLPILNLFVMIIIIGIFILFGNIRLRIIDSETGIIIILSIMLAILVIMTILVKQRHLKICRIITPILATFCICILFSMLILFGANRSEQFKYGISIVSTVICISIIITLNKVGLYKRYKYYFVNITRGIRYATLIILTLYHFNSIKIIENNIVYLIYMLICVIEFIYINIYDIEMRANVILLTRHGKKVTKDKIVQYRGDKIKYRMLDGKEVIVDDNEIRAITYRIKHMQCKNYRTKNKVECIFKNGRTYSFQNYFLISDSWVEFFCVKEGIKYVLVLKLKDIEQIVYEKMRRDRFNDN